MCILDELNFCRYSRVEKVEKVLEGITKKFMAAKCICNEKGLLYYFRALERVRLWPLTKEQIGKSLEEIKAALQSFQYVSPKENCSECRFPPESEITQALEDMDYLVGLCVNCAHSECIRRPAWSH